MPGSGQWLVVGRQGGKTEECVGIALAVLGFFT